MNLNRYLQYPQRSVAIQAAVGALLAKSGDRFLRKRLAPSISELAELTGGMHSDPAGLLVDSSIAIPDLSRDALDAMKSEYDELELELAERYRRHRLAFPSTWAVETGTSFLLYALVRASQPSTIVEIGVGNGQSSFYLLRALRANGRGKLHSFDISAEAGGLLSDHERGNWDFRLVDPARAGVSLTGQLAGLPHADICFHDADHGYLAQYFEFGCLWNQLADMGVLVSDDVDVSYALVDFCALDGKRPEILLDGRKAVGVLRRQSTNPVRRPLALA
ncbi:MAG TPA: class I SAM-dependent methyltransferase [Solirubrobacteraceae bacterium]|jgi:predicted O-methyltransferase YrrM